MDQQYYCRAYPRMPSNSINTQNLSSDKYFNIQFEYRVLGVAGTIEDIQRHTFNHVSMAKIVQEDTFPSLFSQINIPVDAYTSVAEEISECAYDMVYDDKYKNLSVLTIQVEFVVTRSTEDEGNPSFEEVEDESDDEDDYGLEEDMMAEEHNWFTPAAKSCVDELDKLLSYV
ncbi:hypothetical protein TSUD_87170 [Trifolium subterraneum]|uniref:Uncharacterized protein n=1 Tax=Trifolium subterraneum TaxID=3900 RepID=A0A2Z6PP54_TRISU|nr:hypothetical protein TSUD_87170 [Trifolium subterraneum]